MSRMQQAFIFTSPANSAQAVGFISELQRKIVIAVAAGVSWEHAGEFYSAVIRKADKQAESFAGSVGGRPAPDVRWVNDQAFEWVAKLGHREEAAASAKEHASALDALEQRLTKAISSSGLPRKQRGGGQDEGKPTHPRSKRRRSSRRIKVARAMGRRMRRNQSQRSSRGLRRNRKRMLQLQRRSGRICRRR